MDFEQKIKLYDYYEDRLKRLKKEINKERPKRYNFIFVSCLVLSLVGILGVYYFPTAIKVEIPQEVIVVDSIPAEKPIINYKTRQAFLDKLKFMESGNQYNIVNQYGFMGYYQFGRQALEAVGMQGVTNEEFLSNPELQEVAMMMLLKKNKKWLGGYIKKYSGKIVGDIKVTESGILAAAQMAPGGVIKFLTTSGDSIFKDGNGVPITKYIAEFEGYKLEL